jgi:hypothetical protein
MVTVPQAFTFVQFLEWYDTAMAAPGSTNIGQGTQAAVPATPISKNVLATGRLDNYGNVVIRDPAGAVSVLTLFYGADAGTGPGSHLGCYISGVLL